MTPAEPAPARGLPERLEVNDSGDSDLIASPQGWLLGTIYVPTYGERYDRCALAAEIAKRYNAHAGLVAFVERIAETEFNPLLVIGEARDLLAAVRGGA